MFKPTRLAIALAGIFAVSSSAHAGFSATATFTTDYLFDGISQTDSGPALQGSLDYAFDNGIYVGTWASNVDFGSGDDANVEQDFYVGYSFPIGDKVTGDIGVAQYTYYGVPTKGYDYTEYHVGATFFDNTHATLWYADDDDVFGGKSMRFKLRQELPLSDDWTLGFEGTYTHNMDTPDYYGAKTGDSYIHFRVGIATSIQGFDLDLSYNDTNIRAEDDPQGTRDATVVFTVSRTFE